MFVRASKHISVLERLGEAQGTLSALASRCAVQETHMEWLRARVDQLELERSLLLKEVTHLAFPTPAITIRSRAAASHESVDPTHGLPSFEDMGDEEAAREGITHATDGSLL